MELNLNQRTDDFRPESYSPKNYDFRDLNILDRIDTKNNWAHRKQYCIKNVYTNLGKLIHESKAPTYKSLATFRPTTIEGLEIEETDREWKNEWKEIRKQGDLFSQDKDPEIIIRKLPFSKNKIMRIQLIILLFMLGIPLYSQINMEKKSDGILVTENSDSVLFYQTMPKNHNGQYERTNYIHPLWNVDGTILTEDFPADHLHQRGVFWAWLLTLETNDTT